MEAHIFTYFNIFANINLFALKLELEVSIAAHSIMQRIFVRDEISILF